MSNDGCRPDEAAFQQVEQVKHSTRSFLQAARSGGFGVSEQTGRALLDAIHQCQDRLTGSRRTIVRTQSTADYVEALRASLSDLEAGITEAMRHYR